MHPERDVNDDAPENAVVDLEQVTAAVDLLPTVESTSAPADPFAVTAVLSRQLSVTREQWLKYTRNASDPDSSLYTQDQLANALQTPGNEHLVRSASFAASVQTAFPGLHTLTNRYRLRPRSIFGLPLLEPTSKVSAWQGIVMTILDGTYSAFLVPVTIAFSADLNHWSWNTIIDMIAGGLFTADILLLLHTGFFITCSLRKRLIMDGRFVARYYVLHATCFTDFLATIPAWIEFVVLVFLKTRTPTLLLLLLNYMRLFRLLRLMRFMGNMFASSSSQLGKRLNAWVSSTLLYFLSIIYAAAVLINFFGCVWYWVARREGVTNSWLTSVGGQDMSGASDIRQWIVALYFAMTTVTTVGYGDITAHSAVEQCVAIVMMLAGVLFFGILIGSLGEIVQHASIRARQAQMFRRKFEEVEAWMHHRRLPKLTQKKIRNYYAGVWVRHADWKEAEFFDELPAHLRGEVAGYLMEEVFQQSDFFSELAEDVKARLAARLTPQMIPPGHDLCQEGDEADCMWILQEGEVLALGHSKEAELLPAPAVIGEAVILKDQLPAAAFRPCTFRALGSCTVWHLALKDMQTLAHVYPQMLPAMIEAFKGRWEHHLQSHAAHAKKDSRQTSIDVHATASMIAVPSCRRTTAEMATQTMLADLDREHFHAHHHASHFLPAALQHLMHLGPASPANPMHDTSTHTHPQGIPQASHQPYHRTPNSQEHVSLGSQTPHFDPSSNLGITQTHPGVRGTHPEVRYSTVEVSATADEEQACMLAAEQDPASQQSSPAMHAQCGTHIGTAISSQNQVDTGGLSQQPRSTLQQDQQQQQQQQQQHSLTGLGMSAQDFARVPTPVHRSALPSIDEASGVGLNARSPSASRASKKYARQISHSSDLGLISGPWMAAGFANRLLHHQRLQRNEHGMPNQ